MTLGSPNLELGFSFIFRIVLRHIRPIRRFLHGPHRIDYFISFYLIILFYFIHSFYFTFLYIATLLTPFFGSFLFSFLFFLFLWFDKRMGAIVQLSQRHVHSKKVRKIFLEEKKINLAAYIWKENILHRKREAF